MKISRRTLLVGSVATAMALQFTVFAAEAAVAADLNGQVPASRLTNVPSNVGTQPLEKATAAVWLSMVAACKAATGVTMVVTAPDGGYRNLQQQQYLYEHPEGPVPIAAPGTSSHGWGTAIDINNAQRSWLVANAGGYGFYQTFASENWHWQYNGQTAPIVTLGNMREDDSEMAQYYRKNSTGQLGRFGGGVTVFADMAAYEKHRAIVGLWNTANPSFKQPVPPASTAASNFINLDDYGWSVQVAAHGGLV